MRPLIFSQSIAAFVSISLLSGTVAQAGLVGYQAQFFGSNNNIPRIQVTNLSDTASIVEFAVTLNRDGFEFDYAKALGSTGNVDPSLLDPEELQGGQRSDSVQYGFASFDPAGTFTFKTDVDPVGQNKRVDYRSALFDFGGGDPSENATLFVRFNDGSSLTGTLPTHDPASDGSSTFTQTRSTPSTPPPPMPTPIPLPPVVWGGLGMLAMSGLFGAARRRLRLHAGA